MVVKRNSYVVLVLFILLNPDILSQTTDSTSFSIYTRQSFYSFEDNGEMLVKVPANILNTNLVIRLINCADTLAKWNGKVTKEILRIPFILKSLKAKCDIKAEIITKVFSSGNLVKYTAKTSLIILSYKPNEVKIDRLTGGLIVNKKQFFPFGFYCYSPVYPTLPEEEVVRGFNMISPYQKILPETLSERKAYMDRCAQLGMKVHYNLLSVSGGGGVGSKMEGYSDTQKRELLIREIKTFMNHPALLAWYIADEPTGNKVTSQTLETIYKVVKETDPWHPVSIVFMAPFLSAKKYANALDIVMADPYPIPDLPASIVGDVADKLKKVFYGEKPVWIVPQAFGGGELWGREPSVQEIRSMTYQSVINGATGIQYLVRQGLNAFPKSVSVWSECGRMAREIANQRFLIQRAQGLRVGHDAALAAAERHADQRALPGHFHGQAGDVVQRDGGRHSDAAFGRPQGRAMANYEGAETVHLAVTQLRIDREFDAFHGQPQLIQDVGGNLAVNQERSAFQVGE